MTEYPTLKTAWFHILLSLAGGEFHGTAVMEDVLHRTEGTVRLWPGVLYGSLAEMEAQGLIREVDPPEGAPREGGKRRFYAITPRGRGALAEEIARLESFVRLGRARTVGKDLQGA
jgi:DNA-binding PadR family transcriptional regulator